MHIERKQHGFCYIAKEAGRDVGRLIILEEPPLFVRHIMEEDK